jgi:hypothetical protein
VKDEKTAAMCVSGLGGKLKCKDPKCSGISSESHMVKAERATRKESSGGGKFK